ncbi:uncharacterized protein C8R40DRAFT_1169450 [Lentinula edodes]|uniref:uncharacterized protein n=1 Tax=Lentinula edodes TaxID=5353 RepID=UPI001E8E657B|nr:uncharacterized protein C8R40DRAFT_1169450 [Lentinula edodes]KAH7876335.1 hypothetical protein C8R40DRAFT_1169450 [Lentinula edodes]
MSTTLSASSSMITYSHHWSLNNGSMATNNAGATANVTFNGTFVQVFGTIPALKHKTPEPASSYILDDTSPIQFNAARFGETNEVSNFAFYQSNLDLASGKHSLVITSLTNGADFILDSIVFSSNLTATSPTIASETPNPPSSSSSSSSGSSGGTSKPNVGGIVGGTISALVVLAALIAFFLVHRRRKQRTAKRREVTPFVPEHNGSPSIAPNYSQDSYLVSSPSPQPRYDEKEPLPKMSPGLSSLVRHGSMYKPRPDSDNLPPMEFGYGGGV